MSVIRKAVVAEYERRGWSLLKLSEESGMSYSRLHDWKNEKAKPNGDPVAITTDNLELLMKVLELRICRGKIRRAAARR